MASSLLRKNIHNSFVFLDTVGPKSRRHFLALKSSLPFQFVLCCGSAGTLLPLRAMYRMFFLFQRLSSYFNAHITQLRNPLKGSAFAGSLKI